MVADGGARVDGGGGGHCKAWGRKELISSKERVKGLHWPGLR